MLFEALAVMHLRVGQVARRIGTAYATRVHRARLATLGPRTRIAAGVTFWSPEAVGIGVDCLLQRGVGASTELESGSLRIGDGCQINRDAHLDMTGGLTLANGVLISEGVLIYTHDHGLDPRPVFGRGQ